MSGSKDAPDIPAQGIERLILMEDVMRSRNRWLMLLPALAPCPATARLMNLGFDDLVMSGSNAIGSPPSCRNDSCSEAVNTGGGVFVVSAPVGLHLRGPFFLAGDESALIRPRNDRPQLIRAAAGARRLAARPMTLS
jgi:hypothetical protein